MAVPKSSLKDSGLKIKGTEIKEPPHDKTNKMTCAPSEDSDQSGHPPSLMRVFAVRMKKHWALYYTIERAYSEDSDQILGGCPG